MVGTGCEHDGVIYRNGQSFKPSCKYQCVCVNGAIGCVALCRESQPPRVWCQTPRRVKVRGQCCEQWICDEPKRGRKTAPRHAVDGMMPPMLLLFEEVGLYLAELSLIFYFFLIPNCTPNSLSSSLKCNTAQNWKHQGEPNQRECFECCKRTQNPRE